MSSDRIFREDDVSAAYDAAELVLEGFFVGEKPLLLMMDERAWRQTIGKVGRAIADAVIRSNPSEVSGDITDVEGVNVVQSKV